MVANLTFLYNWGQQSWLSGKMQPSRSEGCGFDSYQVGLFSVNHVIERVCLCLPSYPFIVTYNYYHIYNISQCATKLEINPEKLRMAQLKKPFSNNTLNNLQLNFEESVQAHSPRQFCCAVLPCVVSKWPQYLLNLA